jgi:hypothetical protein
MDTAFFLTVQYNEGGGRMQVIQVILACEIWAAFVLRAATAVYGLELWQRGISASYTNDTQSVAIIYKWPSNILNGRIIAMERRKKFRS